MKARVAGLLLALAVLQAADVVTTAVGLRAGAQEANPLGVLLINGGAAALAGAKAVALVVVGTLSWWMIRCGAGRYASAALAGCCGGMAGVVVWNLGVIVGLA